MRREPSLKKALAAFAACALLLAAYSATAALLNTLSLSSRLELLEGMSEELRGSLKAEAESLRGRIGNLQTALEGKLAAEGNAGRADMRRRAELLESRLSRALEGRAGLLSDISLKLDGLDRELSLSSLDAVVKEGRSEGLLLRDISLARSLEEADRFFAADRYADAAARYASVLELLPGNARLRQRRAVCLFRANPADSSAYGFIENELTNPSAGESAESLGALASIAAERQDWGKALSYFDRLVKLRPKDVAALKDAGECALCAGESAQAASYFDRACAADPSDRDAENRRNAARVRAPQEKDP
jgi:tetratricopeptide (TPR) repeat protein